jgi:acyl-CoA synthetase (AMP-forming)/AMP-acid ligase II
LPGLLTTAPSALSWKMLNPDAALSGPDRHWRPDHVWDPDAPFDIHLMSGITGHPRGIVLSARSVLYRGLHAAKMLTMTSETRMAQPNVPIAGTGLSVLLGVLSAAARGVRDTVGCHAAWVCRRDEDRYPSSDHEPSETDGAGLPPAFRPSKLTVMVALPIPPNGKIDLVGLTRLAEGRAAVLAGRFFPKR